jgi:cytochrome b6-f complex iron-sulfur subunit
MNKQHTYTRKDFLKTAGSTALFATLGIGFYGCSNSTDAISDTEVRPPSGGSDAIDISNNGNTISIDLSKESVSGLNQQGGWMLIRDASTLVVNVDGSQIRAFTSVCTHAGCSTNWQFSNDLFECTCHNSRFNTSGSVVRGPATRDLQEFSAARDGDLIVISK